MADKPIVIAGGGIAGLAASLAGWGREVQILERTAEFERIGAGLQIGPNAVAALRALGAWEAVEANTHAPAEIHMRDGMSGKLVKRLRLGKTFEKRFGAPYRTALRADVHAAMLGVVKDRPSISIALGQDIGELQDTTLRVQNKRINAAAVIAADGVHSPLRQQLVKAAAPIDSGLQFHRALLPISNAEADVITVWMLPHGHVVEYAVGKPAKLNLVVIRPVGRQDIFADAAGPLLNTIQRVPLDKPWPGLYVKPLSHWNFGRTVLIGDAAHGTLPFLAQGAAMAFEDAAVLKAAVANTSNIEEAFADYSRSRVVRATRLHYASLRTGQNYHMRQPLAWARNMLLRALPDNILWSSLQWLYSHRS